MTQKSVGDHSTGQGTRATVCWGFNAGALAEEPQNAHSPRAPRGLPWVESVGRKWPIRRENGALWAKGRPGPRHAIQCHRAEAENEALQQTGCMNSRFVEKGKTRNENIRVAMNNYIVHF